MVREAFRKYCKKSETIDHVKTYKCCRGNYEQIQISRQHRTHCHSECLIEHYIRRCSDYLDKKSRYGITKTRIILGGIKQTKGIVNLISVV